MYNFIDILNQVTNLLFCLASLYIIIYLGFNWVKNRQKLNIQNLKSIRLYLDKLFIIKLTKLVKENLPLSVQIESIKEELMAYFDLNEVVLYKNKNFTLKEAGCEPYFVLAEQGPALQNLNLNKYFQENKLSFLKAAIEEMVLVFDQDNEGKVKYFIFPLIHYREIIGALVISTTEKHIFEKPELETIRFSCYLFTLIISYQLKLNSFT